MPKCENFEKCPFFNGRLAQYSPQTIAGMKRIYCENLFTDCARFQIYTRVGGKFVPRNMTPAEHERAAEIIRTNRFSDSARATGSGD